MDILIYLYLAMFVFAAVGFTFGAVRYLRPHKPLYASMITLGIGTAMIGKAYTMLRLLTGLQVTDVFHVGALGAVGAFAFFFSANFGQIDSLVDGGEKKFMKYRVLSVAGILVTALLSIPIILSGADISEKITDLITAAVIAAASYYHVKHILIPDVDYGVVKCLRLYNTTALIYGILCMLEMTALSNRMDILLITACLLEGIASAALIVFMDRGVREWSI